MKQFIIEDGVFDIFPDLKIGVIALHGVDNSGKGLSEQLESICQDARTRLSASEELHPDVAEYKEAMKQIKKKKGAAASIEAMAKRLLKGSDLGSISPAVDIYNYICLKYFLTCGGETLDKIQGDMVLGFARGDEEFVPLGEEENSPPREGELIYYDEAGVIVRSWLWREADRTKITADTKELLIYMECINKERYTQFGAAMEELFAMLKNHLGGEGTLNYLTKDAPTCEI